MDGLWAEESQTGSKALVGVQNGVMSLEKGKIVLLLWLNDFTQLWIVSDEDDLYQQGHMNNLV